MATRWMRDLQRLRDAALGTAGALVDRAAVDLALELCRSRMPPGSAESPEAQLRVLARVAEVYDPAHWPDGREGFFAPPPAPTVTERRVASLPEGGAPGRALARAREAGNGATCITAISSIR